LDTLSALGYLIDVRNQLCPGLQLVALKRRLAQSKLRLIPTLEKATPRRVRG
jgi:hypothetical protein